MVVLFTSTRPGFRANGKNDSHELPSAVARSVVNLTYFTVGRRRRTIHESGGANASSRSGFYVMRIRRARRAIV